MPPNAQPVFLTQEQPSVVSSTGSQGTQPYLDSSASSASPLATGSLETESLSKIKPTQTTSASNVSSSQSCNSQLGSVWPQKLLLLHKIISNPEINMWPKPAPRNAKTVLVKTLLCLRCSLGSKLPSDRHIVSPFLKKISVQELKNVSVSICSPSVSLNFCSVVSLCLAYTYSGDIVSAFINSLGRHVQ